MATEGNPGGSGTGPQQPVAVKVANPEAEKLLQKGLEALRQGDTCAALGFLERAAQQEKSPTIASHLAYCLARERQDFAEAASLCIWALKQEPRIAVHYLNLGRIHLLTGNKKEAFRMFRRGLSFAKDHPAIVRELRQLGFRKRPLLPFLSRENPLNKYLGKALARLGLR